MSGAGSDAMARESAHQMLDRLLDWYDTHRRPVTEVRLNITIRTARQFCYWQWGKADSPLYYRGRRIVTRERT